MKKNKLFVLALVVLAIIIVFLVIKVSNNNKKKKESNNNIEMTITEYWNDSTAGRKGYDKAFVTIKDNKATLHYSAKDSELYGEDTIINVKNLSDEETNKIIKLLDKGNKKNKYTSSDTYIVYYIEYNNKKVYVDSKADNEKIIKKLFEE